jgi:curved DNA-binding protein CbpA
MTGVLDRPVAAEDEDPGGVDAFRVLGLPYSPDLTDDDVRRAYLLRVRAAHPDNGGNTIAAAAVTAAYDALRSGVRRGELLAAATLDRGGAEVPGRPRRAEMSRVRPGRVPDAARREQLRARVAASRAAQGLPPYVTDEATLDKIADLLVVMLGRRDTRGRRTPRSVGSAWPGWDSPWWDEIAGRPRAVKEQSSWRRERGRRRAEEQDRARAGTAAMTKPWPRRLWARVRHGRPRWLVVRVVVAVALPLLAQLAVPGDPAVPALAVGAFTWLFLTARLDLYYY